MGNGCALPTSASNPDGGVGLGGIIPPGGGLKGMRANSKTSLHNSVDMSEDHHLEEEEANWSSEYSASEEEEDLETFGGGHEVGSRRIGYYCLLRSHKKRMFFSSILCIFRCRIRI